MAQMNPTVGDLNGNVHRIVEWIGEARKAQADLIAFSELAITGYSLKTFSSNDSL
jgi:NAD+ synthase (glutamine-hydrolysing)